jgi:hypothetical protein
MKYTTIYVELISPRGKKIEGQIIVRDGFALSIFSDPDLAKQLYEADFKKGLDVAYNEEKKAYIQRYSGLKKESIIKKIEKELEKAGGKLKVFKD